MSEVDAPVRYREPGSRYVTTAVLAGVIIAGFVVDLSLGGGAAHAIGDRKSVV